MKCVTLLLLLVWTVGDHCRAECHPRLGNYAHGFDALEADALSFLDDALRDVRVVGYGEDTHGTAQFTSLAQALMEYLSSEHGFKIFIIETGFGEGRYLDDYVQGKRDDLDTILDTHNSTWRYATGEFVELMHWLRHYNQTNAEKIHVYGSEMQYTISDVTRLREFLATVGSDYNIAGFEKHLWQSFDEVEKAAYFLSYSELKQYLQGNRVAFVDKTSASTYEMAMHHVEVLGQFASAINQNVEQRKHDLRDL